MNCTLFSISFLSLQKPLHYELGVGKRTCRSHIRALIGHKAIRPAYDHSGLILLAGIPCEHAESFAKDASQWPAQTILLLSIHCKSLSRSLEGLYGLVCDRVIGSVKSTIDNITPYAVPSIQAVYSSRPCLKNPLANESVLRTSPLLTNTCGTIRTNTLLCG